jgi:hypothetical protein
MGSIFFFFFFFFFSVRKLSIIKGMNEGEASIGITAGGGVEGIESGSQAMTEKWSEGDPSHTLPK